MTEICHTGSISHFRGKGNSKTLCQGKHIYFLFTCMNIKFLIQGSQFTSCETIQIMESLFWAEHGDQDTISRRQTLLEKFGQDHGQIFLKTILHLLTGVGRVMIRKS